MLLTVLNGRRHPGSCSAHSLPTSYVPSQQSCLPSPADFSLDQRKRLVHLRCRTWHLPLLNFVTFLFHFLQAKPREPATKQQQPQRKRCPLLWPAATELQYSEIQGHQFILPDHQTSLLALDPVVLTTNGQSSSKDKGLHNQSAPNTG